MEKPVYGEYIHCMIKEIDTPSYYLNGKPELNPLPSWFTHLGIGVFETLRVQRVKDNSGIEFRILGLNLHLDRLFEGARFIRAINLQVETIVETIKAACNSFFWSDYSDARLRITLFQEDWMVQMEPWRPSLDQEKGISCVTFDGERTISENKSCSAIVSAIARMTLKEQQADEALLVDREGIIREGSWSNFFWISSKDELITPATRILKGVTRSLVLELAAKGLKVHERDCTTTSILSQAKEAFITQTSHGIVPVIKINQQLIGSGVPGQVTKKLRADYESLLKLAEEPLTTRFR
ncbi:MAG: aminotransferase class IV [Bdellovibrionales bacterium]|nr:aminotransferase class IV [Bdellovibrionales bacterium]